MQYAAEITRPTPEGTSAGIIQLFSQASVVFVYLMEALQTKGGAFTPALLLAVGLIGHFSFPLFSLASYPFWVEIQVCCLFNSPLFLKRLTSNEINR